MSDRTYGRGGRGGGRGGNRGNTVGRGGNVPQEKPKKEAILNLAKYVDQQIRVKFSGGREVVGVLKGYDQLMNLVMDDVEELLHNPADGETTGQRRSLGLAVLRGTNLTLISPMDGFEMIENPFSQAE
ncbi:Similar to S.cerevisiae protein LSM7 (Lsm (Like Sm) protein) [Malassezia sympodialis ATCC 42132]|uniref:Similar to S.cerevisiae protein LSM7 (Lsm (Like Sm) protein) n=1 Tax=Malassezia sympodialis (strain ATCC 42132) TaxID=1230383 RepID=A0A1M8A1F1_MALS4|nr:Similar to S.cerevisiae protein LSM7 (Lsm (Like Sm) protein) [Malassezia sympodialis ATCC 42132]